MHAIAYDRKASQVISGSGLPAFFAAELSEPARGRAGGNNGFFARGWSGRQRRRCFGFTLAIGRRFNFRR